MPYHPSSSPPSSCSNSPSPSPAALMETSSPEDSSPPMKIITNTAAASASSSSLMSKAAIITAAIRRTHSRPSKKRTSNSPIRHKTNPNYKSKTHCFEFENFDLSFPVPAPVYKSRNISSARVAFYPHKFRHVPVELRAVLPPVPLMRRLQDLRCMSFYWKGGQVVEDSGDTRPLPFRIVLDEHTTAFSVNGGPRRPLDNEHNLAFMKSITSSICPEELEHKDNDVVLYFRVEKRS